MPCRKQWWSWIGPVGPGARSRRDSAFTRGGVSLALARSDLDPAWSLAGAAPGSGKAAQRRRSLQRPLRSLFTNRKLGFEQALEPASNVADGARFLKRLRLQTRSWARATARYHSSDPDRGQAYRDKV